MSMKAKTAAIIQARMTSSRLPGKTLAPILDRPMLAHMLERVGRARRIDRIIVAAVARPEDDPIARLCDALGTPCFRGSEQDVLARFHGAALAFAPEAETLIRLTADCPLIDPAILDAFIAAYEADWRADYVWEGAPPKIPNGFAAEVFSRAALDAAQAGARAAYEREHVTPFIRNPANGFGVAVADIASTAPHLRLSVDMPEDLEVVRRLFEALYPANPEFSLADIEVFLADHPEIVALNAHIEQKTGPYAPDFSE